MAEVVAAEVILHPILKVIRCGGLEEKRLEVVNVFGAQACARKKIVEYEYVVKAHMRSVLDSPRDTEGGRGRLIGPSP